MNDALWTATTIPIDGLDDLRGATQAAAIEIVQLQPGRLRGLIRHYALADTMAVRRGQFTCGLRTRGAMPPGKITFVVALASAGRFTQWGQEVRPGDVAILPPKTRFDFIFQGSIDYVLVALPPSDLPSGADHLADPAFWSRGRVLSVPPPAGATLLRELGRILAAMEEAEDPSPQAVDLFRRSLLKSLLGALASADGELPASPAALLVSRVDDYLDGIDGRNSSIDELIDHLHVSRRSLHRAFKAALGIGPVAYLRRKHFSAVFAILRESDPATTSIHRVAEGQGFTGERFSAHYKQLFGETPHQTLHRRR